MKFYHELPDKQRTEFFSFMGGVNNSYNATLLLPSFIQTFGKDVSFAKELFDWWLNEGREHFENYNSTVTN